MGRAAPWSWLGANRPGAGPELLVCEGLEPGPVDLRVHEDGMDPRPERVLLTAGRTARVSIVVRAAR